MIEAGKLDRRITIQRKTVTKDAFNAPIETWTDLTEVAASADEVPDGEKWQAAEVSASITTRFVIRWSSVVRSVNAKDRLLYGGLIYDIARVKEIGRHEGLEITANARPDLSPPTDAAA